MFTTIAVAPYLTTGSSCCLKQLYHKAAGMLYRSSGLDATEHDDAFLKAGERGWNTFYKMIGHAGSVHCLTSKQKLLIRALNRPEDAWNNSKAWEKVAVEAKKMLKPHPFIQIKDEQYFPIKGVCLGIVQQFISGYLTEINLGQSPKDSAILAAKHFEKGGGLLACALQQIHKISKPDDEAIKKAYGQKSDLECATMHQVMSSVYGYSLLKLSSETSIHDCSDPTGFRDLENGVYQIASGVDTTYDDSSWHWSFTWGHVIALIVDNNSFYIFDPNIGLFSDPNPDAYCAVEKTYVNGLLFVSAISKP